MLQGIFCIFPHHLSMLRSGIESREGELDPLAPGTGEPEADAIFSPTAAVRAGDLRVKKFCRSYAKVS